MEELHTHLMKLFQAKQSADRKAAKKGEGAAGQRAPPGWMELDCLRVDPPALNWTHVLVGPERERFRHPGRSED